MAKTQSFADKAKGKVKADTVAVKCIVSFQDETSGTWKFREKLIKVKATKEILTMKF
jgi:hypothetical protein